MKVTPEGGCVLRAEEPHPSCLPHYPPAALDPDSRPYYAILKQRPAVAVASH